MFLPLVNGTARSAACPSRPTWASYNQRIHITLYYRARAGDRMGRKPRSVDRRRPVEDPVAIADLHSAEEALEGLPADLYPQAGRVVEAHQPVGPRPERAIDQVLRQLGAPRRLLEVLEALRRREDVERRGQAQVALEGVVHVDRAALLGQPPHAVGGVEPADAPGVDLDEAHPAVFEEVLGEAEAVRALSRGNGDRWPAGGEPAVGGHRIGEERL